MGKVIKQLSAADKLQLAVISGTDHIFSPLSSQADLFLGIDRWIQNI
jgi:hypothetical protein